ncbi:MAG: response regulator [Desulfobacteraceae bacterium]|nr:response regulator [Desulfobacteraceae bacterium]
MISIKNMTVLIVDDVKSMRSIVRKMLKRLDIGGVIHMAENGLEALRILHSTQIDLAIVDWKMPIMNGAKLLETLRADRSIRDTPVLVVTAESEIDVVLEAAEIVVDGYLIKPLTPAVLDEKIKSIIRSINHPEKADLHIKKARTLEEEGLFQPAIEHLKHAAKLRPSASRILRNLGLLYQKNGDEKKMEMCLHKAAVVNPQDAVTRHMLGELYWKKNDLVLAGKNFLEALSITGKFLDRTIDLCDVLLEKNLVRLAKKIISKILTISPKDVSLKERILDICIEHKEYEYSKKLLRRFIREHPSNYDLTYRAGVVCLAMEDVKKALEYFMEIDKHRFQRIDVKLEIAKIFYKLKKELQADNYLNEILRIDPKNEEALALRQLL